MIDKRVMPDSLLHNKNRNKGEALWAALALLWGGMGQWLLGEKSILLGLGLYLLGVAAFVIGLRAFSRDAPDGNIPAAPVEASAVGGRRSFPFGFWLSGITLVCLAASAANAEGSLWGGMLVVGVWAVGVALFAISILRLEMPWRTSGEKTSRWLQANWKDLTIAAAAFVIAVGVRTYDLELHPYSFVNDEGQVGRNALALLSGKRSDLFAVGWGGHPILSFVPAALAVAMLGNTAFAIRLVSALKGALAVALVYCLGRQAFDRLTGILAAGLLLALPWHVHFSRLAVMNVDSASWAVLVVWLTYRAIKWGKITDYLLAGLAGGAAIYSYVGSRLALVLAVSGLGYAAVLRRGYLREYWRHVVVFVAAAVMVLAPQAVYFARHQDEFVGRLRAEGILYNGWLERETAATGRSIAAILLDQFAASTLVYVAGDAPLQFFNSPRPYLAPAAAVFFVLGLGVCFWRLRELRYALLVIWLGAAVILGSTLTVGPPSSQRLIISAPAVALIFAIGLRQLAWLAQRAGILRPGLVVTICGALTLAVAVEGLLFYFGEYRQGHYFEEPGNELPYEVSCYAAAFLNDNYRLYLLGFPGFASFPNFDYLAPQVETVDFNEVTPATVAALPREGGAFFVALPERLDDLRLTAQLLSGGHWITVRRRFQPEEILYYAYLISPFDEEEHR